MNPWIAGVGFFAILAGALYHSLSRSWNRTLAAFAVQSLGVGLAAWQISPLPMAITKCVVGWLAASLIAVTLSREGAIHPTRKENPISMLFRAAILLMMLSAVVTLLPQIGRVFFDPPAGIVACAGFLISVGLIDLSLSEHPLRIGIGLLTVLQGFELAYLWEEQSLLVIGLLAMANLAIILSLIALFSFSLSPLDGKPSK